MSLPVIVLNFDEFLSNLSGEKEFQINTSKMEETLNKYFPEILELLKKMKEQNIHEGIQKIKGFMSNGNKIEFINDKDIKITGITFSQNVFDNRCEDRWNIYIDSKEALFKIFDNVYSKDSLQHKFFNKFYPVPKGHKLIIEPINTGENKNYWIDIEYLEVI